MPYDSICYKVDITGVKHQHGTIRSSHVLGLERDKVVEALRADAKRKPKRANENT